MIMSNKEANCIITVCCDSWLRLDKVRNDKPLFPSKIKSTYRIPFNSAIDFDPPTVGMPSPTPTTSIDFLTNDCKCRSSVMRVLSIRRVVN